MKTVHLWLHLGDARTAGGDVGIMGFRNSLKPELECSVKKEFVPFVLPGTKVRGDFLVSNNRQPWRYTLALKMKFKRDVYEQPSDVLSTTLAYSYQMLRSTSITILPLSWRYPERAACATLFSIWMSAYFSEHIFKTSRFPLHITLSGRDTLQPYEDLLNNDAAKLWNYIEAIYDQSFTLFAS